MCVRSGWTILDRLYLWNGTLFIVNDAPASLPDRNWMISEGHWIENGPEAEQARLPTDQTLKVISTTEAKKLFGGSVDRLDGVTVSDKRTITYLYVYLTILFQWLTNDPPQLCVIVGFVTSVRSLTCVL
jgi:hypothetical protein